MTGKLWAVGVIVALLVLAVGALMFFFVLLGLNGFISLRLPVVEVYLLSLVVTLVLTVWGSVVGARTLAARTAWSFWAVGPLTIVGAVIGAFVVMLVCAFIALAVASSTVRG